MNLTSRKFASLTPPLALVFIIASCSGGGSGGGGGGGGGGSANVAPVARISANPTSGAAPLTVQFDASTSSDPDGSITAYAWQFGDGATANGAVVSHDYLQAGAYTARLTVTDNRGGTGTATTSINVIQPVSGVWLGEYESSLMAAVSLRADLDRVGNSMSGTFADADGRSGTITGSINGQAVTLQLVSTTPGCAGDFTGSGAIDPDFLPGADALIFSFTGTDCRGAHTDGAALLVFQTAAVVAWGQSRPTGLVHRDAELFWSDNSAAPLKKLDTATGTVTPLASRMVSISSLSVGDDYVLWTDRSGDIGNSGCVGRGVSRTLVIADAQGSNARDLAAGDFCGSGQAPEGTLTDGTYAYWVVAESGAAGRIERIPLAGGSPQLLASPGYGFNGMAIDGTHLYWSESSIAEFSKIFRCPVSGCGGQAPETLLATGDEFTIWRGIVLAGDQLVFGSRRTGEPMYEISVLPTSGGVPTKIADSPGQVGQLLTDGNSAFWLSDDILRSVPLAGGPVSVIVPDFYYVQDIALGPDRVYWADASYDGGFPDGIYYAAKAGGAVSKLVDAYSPYRLAVAAAGNVVYVDSGPTGYEPTGYYRVTPGGTVIDSATGLAGQSLLAVDDMNIYAVQGFNIKSVGRSSGITKLLAETNFYVEALDTDGSYVYWLEDPLGTVFRAPVDGSAALQALGFNNEKAMDMKVSGDYVYWLGGGDRLSRVPKDGSGPVETLADDLAFAERLVVDDTYIYVIEADARRLTRMTHTGTSRTPIGDTGLNYGWYAMTQDTGNVYWAKAGTLSRVAKSGAGQAYYPEIITPDQFMPEWIAVDGQYIYWTEDVFGAIKRAAK